MLSDKVERQLWVGFFAFLLFWSINAYVLLGQWLQEGELFALKIDDRPYISDFVVFYAGGLLAKRCLAEPQAVYDIAAQAKVIDELTAPIKAEQPFFNQNTPITYLIVMLFAFLDLSLAWIAWCLIWMLASIAAVVLLIMPRFQGRFTRALVLVAFISAYPTWQSARLGQTSLLIFPCLVWFLHLLETRSFVKAGLITGLLSVKVQYLPYLGLVGLIIGGWRYLLAAAGSTGALVVASGLVLGWQNVFDWPKALLMGELPTGVSGLSPERMQNVRGFLTLLTGQDSTVVHILSAAAFLASVVFTGVMWWRAKKAIGEVRQEAIEPADETVGKKTVGPDRFRGDSMFLYLSSITLLVMMVAGLHTHVQDYILCLPACAYAFILSRREEAGANFSKRMLRLQRILALGFPVMGWIFFLLLPVFALIKVQPYALWAVILCAMLVFQFFIKRPMVDE